MCMCVHNLYQQLFSLISKYKFNTYMLYSKKHLQTKVYAELLCYIIEYGNRSII